MDVKPDKQRMTKNSKIKQSLFRDKRKKKPRHEMEADEIKRLKKLLNTEYNNATDCEKIKRFEEFPISKKTLSGLLDGGYKKPTDIQRQSLGLSLRGLDVLGAAKTGSGKTLAFVIPILEKLYVNLWTNLDGLGALVITPTRELAYQIFETLRKVGKKHDFSAGLIIGGKDLKAEQKRVDQLNIIICTPGRLLQHMDQNPAFDTSNLQILVLDEADRCLDMGFERDMNAIIQNLPLERQTLLFSATQTKSVKDLARLSLRHPVYVSVHETAEQSTPEQLQQSYIVCPADRKLDTLWSFIKHHKKSKILVFLASCKQVRFVHMLFCRMRPGLSVLALHGGMHQLKRMDVYDEFCKKSNALLLATDIAARGLDFPAIDWVLQLDCPEDSTTYIHRVGRTARYNSDGEALLVLLPTEEEPMIEQLKGRRIPIEKIEVDASKCVSVEQKFQALLARDINLKDCAQRAFKAYLKSMFLMKNKDVFNVSNVDLESLAKSMGLAVAPRVRFLQKQHGTKQSCIEETKNKKPCDERPSAFDFGVNEEEGSDDDLFKSKKPAEIGNISEEDFSFLQPESKTKKPKSKTALAKKALRKNIQVNKKTVFDDEGEAVPDIRRDRQSQSAKEYDLQDLPGIDIEKAKEILKEEDIYDKQIFRERIREKHREERLKKRNARKTKHEVEEDSGSEGPDLSWLPDPDKVYSDSGATENTEGSNIDVDYSGPESDSSSSKTTESRRKKLKRSFVTNDMDNDLMEELAMKLIRR